MVNNPWSGAAALMLFSFLPTSLLSQGSWSQTPTSGPLQPLGGHAAAYDLALERMVLFGGFDASYTMQGMTLGFDGVTWTPLLSPTAPSARAGHAMAYDALRGRVVLFGGTSTMLASSNLIDTWEHDGSVWTQRLNAFGPTARVDHAMCYDLARNRVVLHGGRVNNVTPLGDTWEWDGTNWVNMWAVAPPPRYGQAMCFDVTRTHTVMFGGFTGQNALGDTWQWDGTTWQQAQSAAAPSPRSGHAMAYDMSRSVSVMHGGIPNGAETWEWDGTAWTQHGSSFYPRNNHTLVYDARHQRSTSVGGTAPGNPIFFVSEVRTYGHTVPGTYVAHGSSCPGSTATPHLFSPTAVSTGPMIGQTSVVQVTPSWVHTFFAFGWSDTFDGTTPLPHDLSSYGMPGCSLQVSRDFISSAVPVNGVASMLIPIANDPFLVGVRFYVQGFSLDLGANPGGFTTTNRLEATVGRT